MAATDPQKPKKSKAKRSPSSSTEESTKSVANRDRREKPKTMALRREKENAKEEGGMEKVKLKGRTNVGIVSDPVVKPKKIRVRRLSSGGATDFTRRLLHMHAASPPPAGGDKK